MPNLTRLPKKVAGAVSWRLRFLLTDPVFPLRERLRYVSPFGRQPTPAELVSQSLRRTRDGRPYYRLGGWRLFVSGDHDIDDEAALLSCIEIVLRESFLYDELLWGPVQVSPNDVVLDLGANIGTCSLQFGRRVTPAGRVYAFEPLTHRTLAQNLALNGAGNVDVVPVCVSDRVGTAELRFSDETINASLRESDGNGKAVHTKPVPVTTIDRFVDERGLDRVDLLKLDIEGAEELALHGATATLERFRPKMTIASYHTDHEGEPQHDKLVRLLHRIGYHTREVRRERIYAWA